MLKNIHLIMFFDIYNIMKLTKNCQVDFDVHRVESYTDKGVTSSEREVQTELHPVPCHKDAKYVWNLWDFRRKAVEMVSDDSLQIRIIGVKNISGEPSSQKDNFRTNCDDLSQAWYSESAPRTETKRLANWWQQEDEHWINFSSILFV